MIQRPGAPSRTSSGSGSGAYRATPGAETTAMGATVSPRRSATGHEAAGYFGRSCVNRVRNARRIADVRLMSRWFRLCERQNMDLLPRLVLAAAALGSAPFWWPRMRGLRRALQDRRWGAAAGGILLIGAVGLVAIQWIPYGWGHTNPPVTSEPTWDTPTTRDLAVRACFACHSNETTWPWYSKAAPTSWLAVSDVESGRHELNFSTWDQAGSKREARSSVEVVEDGSMPPLQYKLIHPESRLTDTERTALADGLRRSVGAR